ncbi:alpha/beta hydrolase [Luteimonas sp. MC1572]|uniref:alpha/beta hydrolase n=1 Tax=Luteimonas sp. MC1572 TaxID=2799325 RepID=UPI0018F0B688|nr:alpha/beta hydrolase [Luteimonas sp. MC1572]MBJ6981339.1 alpha/beta fold hydrolase [Luteimonas sp. MC1572]QQO02655.1 alpha/beta fold hydrolase [Luteimonas sp. MC1572]
MPATARRVLLLHGLWMPPLAMHRFAARLRAAGFTTGIIGYRSILGSTGAAVDALRARLRGSEPTHLVGHSLGGLVALQALQTEPGLPVARVVCLGTPLCGSGAAHALSRRALTALYLGRSAALLRQGCIALPQGVEVGMVAGSRPHGLGALVARFEEPHDGTVAVAETRLPGLAGHVVIDASHSGLLVSAEAARLAITFLRDGRFAR